MLIQKTKDYDKFKTIAGNRDIDYRHYVDLSKQILSKNLLYASPIIVNKKMEVIDGQHRLKIAKDNNLDVYYVMAGDEKLQDIMELNAHTKNWSLNDYINAYIKTGNENYKILKEFSDEYKMKPTLSAELLGGRVTIKGSDEKPNITGGANHNLHFYLRTGRFVVKWEKEAGEIVEHVIALEPFYNWARHDRTLIRAVRRLYIEGKEEVIKRIEQRLNNTGRELERQYSIENWLRELEEVVNFHVPEDNRIRLF